MNDLRRSEIEVLDDNCPLCDRPGDARIHGPDRKLAEWAAELEHRIELLEWDIALLCKAAGLAGVREKELLNKLGLPDDTLQRHNAELLAQIAGPPEGQTARRDQDGLVG